MNVNGQVLWAIDNEIDPASFERLCVDLLGREGYRHIVPVGGMHDHGRDAEVRYWKGSSNIGSIVAFQFSLQEDWEKKLRSDISKITRLSSEAVGFVFVTSRDISGAKQDALRDELRAKYGWEFVAYTREWLRHRLTEIHQDLAKKYLGLDLPPTISFTVTQVAISSPNDAERNQMFRHAGPELVRASIVESTRKEPSIGSNWLELAKIDFILRNYDSALVAVNRAIALADKDPLLQLNIVNLKGAILGDMAIRRNSRPLLIEAREIFENAVANLDRPVDHFNFANVTSALGELDLAKAHYSRAVELDSEYAEAWNNFGNLLFQQNEDQQALECFDRALAINPNLSEAHLGKARIALFRDNDPIKAITSFETAINLSPDIDNRFQHVRYWFAAAWIMSEKPDEALKQAEIGLSLRPDDTYLLNQKAVALSMLARRDPSYEDAAIGFLEFRAKAIRNDFPGLVLLLDILSRSAKEDRAWDSIEATLIPGLRAVADECGVSLQQLHIGFRYAKKYDEFRERCSLVDHCAKLNQYGLKPTTRMLPLLDLLLLAPFGGLEEEFLAAKKAMTEPNIQVMFERTLTVVRDAFCAFAPHWLARSKPDKRDDQVSAISLGILYFPDIVVAETARLVGYLAGRFQYSMDLTVKAEDQHWQDVTLDIQVRFMEQVFKAWGLPVPGTTG